MLKRIICFFFGHNLLPTDFVWKIGYCVRCGKPNDGTSFGAYKRGTK